MAYLVGKGVGFFFFFKKKKNYKGIFLPGKQTPLPYFVTDLLMSTGPSSWWLEGGKVVSFPATFQGVIKSSVHFYAA